MNSKLSKKYGTPRNASASTGGNSTEASSRPAINASVNSGKFTGKSRAATGLYVKGVGK